MKKILLAFLLSFSGALHAQTIEHIQAYVKLDGTRFMAHLSDNSIWWFAKNTWQSLPKTDLPDKPIVFLDAYVKIAIGDLDTRVICVLNDNTIWWFAEKTDSWQQIKPKGFPEGRNIKDFKAYVKAGTMGMSETRFVAVLDDNSIWWFSIQEKWQQVKLKDFPEGRSIRFLRTYQKASVMGTDTRYAVQLDDNSIWWCDTKKWHKLETKGTPTGKPFILFDIFNKGGAQGAGLSLQDGRLIAVLEDQSIWWMSASEKEWKRLPATGLPAGYKFRALESYQKFEGLTNESRLLALLEDGTLWWYAHGKNWSPVPMQGLPK